jgi:hypothetical protein
MNFLSPQSARLFLSILVLLGPVTGHSQEPERWFQVEVSVFSNENQADRDAEVWSPERTELTYPDNLQQLRSLFEVLLSAALQPATEPPLAPASDVQNRPGSTPLATARAPAEPSVQEIRREIIAATGPFPPAEGEGYRFPDFARDAFLQLPPSESEFQQTNRALERSPEHRLLFHGLWRQPVPDPGAELPVAISGGDRFGEHWELEGSLSFHFNANRDRVVVDSNVWLTEFTVTAPSPLLPQQNSEPVRPDAQQPTWQLPNLPAQLAPAVVASPLALQTNDGLLTNPAADEPVYAPRIIYQLQQSREMSSDEFHYIDHPALGLIVTVLPYEVPPLPESGTAPPEPPLDE